MTWPCFTVRETGREARWLRRYSSSGNDPCPAMPGRYSHHAARTRIEDGPYTRRGQIAGTDPPAYYHGSPPFEDYADDPRWPAACSCGRPFAESDKWQVFTDAIYRADDDREWPGDELPTGAMYDAPYHRPFGHVGPDGLSLTVVLPPGRGTRDAWCIDGPSSSGGRWTRTGIPPAITASPSILTGSYHGFLQNGVLTDCLPDRAGELARATAAIAAGRS